MIFFWAKEGETSFIMDVQTFCIVEMGLSSLHDRLSLHLISQEIIMKKVEHYQFLFFEGNDCLNIDHKFPMWRSIICVALIIRMSNLLLITQDIRNLSKRLDQLCF